MAWVRAPVAALSLLTIAPVPLLRAEASDLRRAALFFPLVGAALGALLGACAPLLSPLPSEMLTGIALVALLALLTGGLHLDGLADSFDALGGARGQPERARQILADPRIGSVGAAALCLLLLAKCQLFGLAATRLSLGCWLLVTLVPRYGTLLCLCLMPPARSQGLAAAVVPGRRGLTLTLGSLYTAAICLACAGAPSRALWLMLAPVAAALPLWLWAQLRLGGHSGDIHGAAIELGELAVVATALFVT
ncbi:MAG: adenosylcobinamide-GDP ribazoletransferase [Myxococcales bacterium]|nr:adenosylcobinamide-GDP ribazoletransferase [Myxococcales bacterium]